MTDIARTLALTAKSIDCIFGESRAQMNADEYEIEEAVLEGVKLWPQRLPIEILGDEYVTGIQTKKVKSLIDAQGRFNPQYIDGCEEVFPCDSRHRLHRPDGQLELRDRHRRPETHPARHHRSGPGDAAIHQPPGRFRGRRHRPRRTALY